MRKGDGARAGAAFPGAELPPCGGRAIANQTARSAGGFIVTLTLFPIRGQRASIRQIRCFGRLGRRAATHGSARAHPAGAQARENSPAASPIPQTNTAGLRRSELPVHERLRLRRRDAVNRVRREREDDTLSDRRRTHELLAKPRIPADRHEVRDHPTARTASTRGERFTWPSVACPRRERRSVACPSVGARKKTQATQTYWKVRNTLSGPKPSRPRSVSPNRRCHIRVPASATPWSPPQITKFHDAPCHSPPSSNVIIKFRNVLHAPPRDPPSGMYR